MKSANGAQFCSQCGAKLEIAHDTYFGYEEFAVCPNYKEYKFIFFGGDLNHDVLELPRVNTDRFDPITGKPTGWKPRGRKIDISYRYDL